MAGNPYEKRATPIKRLPHKESHDRKDLLAILTRSRIAHVAIGDGGPIFTSLQKTCRGCACLHSPDYLGGTGPGQERLRIIDELQIPHRLWSGTHIVGR